MSVPSASPGGELYFIDVSPTPQQQRLFTPGTGATPPALTGREREQGVLTQCLADLLGGTSPPHDVVLTGPRGAGKTVLTNCPSGRAVVMRARQRCRRVSKPGLPRAAAERSRRFTLGGVHFADEGDHREGVEAAHR